MEDKYNSLADGISNRTISKIMSVWEKSGKAKLKIKPDIPEEDQITLEKLINSSIKKSGGRISHQAKLTHLAVIFLKSTDTGKLNFLKILSSKFNVDINIIESKIKELKSENIEESEKIKIDIELSKALTPPRVVFLRQLSSLPNGFIFLKDMREFLLKYKNEIPSFKILDNDIKTILKRYFDVNLLRLREINWNSSAATLERLIQYEAVHEIKSWRHLKHRLFSDRRMFGFFHPSMPKDPIIFVEIALVKGLADSIQKLIELDAEKENLENADTAIFYSISSTQKGLRGISFGDFLIKTVVKKLSSDYSNIQNFASLSPIPLFSSWLVKYLKNDGENFCRKSQIDSLCKLSNQDNGNKAILELLNKQNWHKNDEIVSVLKTPLMTLCLHYLSKVKRRGKLNAYDPVANFHLSNGAQIGQLNWLGDISDKGIKQSCGIMVNYKYQLNRIIKNHELYLTKGEINISLNIYKNKLSDGIKNIITKK